MSQNSVTLNSYEQHIDEYVNGTPQEVSGAVKAWIDVALEYLPQGGRILELGSAFGRDADYIEERGFDVRRTDAAMGFVELLRSKGHKAEQLNAITDDLGEQYDMVFANAVILHFTPTEAKSVIDKVHTSLNQNGVLAFTVKQGIGDEVSLEKLGAPRYFNYWQPDQLVDLLEESSFGVIQINDADSTFRLDTTWLHVIALKQQVS